MKRIVILVVIALILFGCARVNYIGVSYPPTRRVDLYFSEYDVRADYVVIGQIVATSDVTSHLFGDEKFQAKVIKKAREKGADGVIILGFDHVLAVTHDFDCRTGDVDRDITEKRKIQALAIKYEL